MISLYIVRMDVIAGAAEIAGQQEFWQVTHDEVAHAEGENRLGNEDPRHLAAPRLEPADDRPQARLVAGKGGKRIVGLHQGLRQHFGRQVPAIILSGDTSATTTGDAQRAGIPLLHKPVRPARLRALLQRKTQA